MMIDEKALEQLRDDAAALAAVLIDLLDRGVVSGVHERERLGTLPALGRCSELGERMDEAEQHAHDCESCRRSKRAGAAARLDRERAEAA